MRSEVPVEFRAGASGRAARGVSGADTRTGTSARAGFGAESGSRASTREGFGAESGSKASAREGFGLADPVSVRRWAAEAQLIQLTELDRRSSWRRRTAWIAIVLFLLADIAVAGGLILGQL